MLSMICPNVNLLYWIELKVVFYKDLLCQLWKFLKHFNQWVFKYFILFHVLYKVYVHMYLKARDQYQGFSLFVLHLLFETVSVSLWSCYYMFNQLTSTPWFLSVFFFPILRLELLLIAMPGYYMGYMERNHIFMLARHVLYWPSYPSSQPLQSRYSISVYYFISGEEYETFQKIRRQPRMKAPLNLEK